ncbi:MAG: redoxin domain-containing protein [Bacteroidaceae bacterium]|nr:redoxin domain-containing protein [Bacteroidaceae bacterium]
MKKTLIIALLALIVATGHSKEKTVVWENPTTEYGTSYGDGYFNVALDITKVELKEKETLVYMTVMQRSDYSDYWYQFASKTFLKVGDIQYFLISADGTELDKHCQTGKDGKADVVLHFHPLPQDTKVFDFSEGDFNGAWQIWGIKPVEERWKQLFPSYWCDDKGDWKIAFFEDCVIYDCQFWNYSKSKVNPKTGEAEIVMSNGSDELIVSVGKDKKGTRTIQIGDQKASYNMITSRFMPDYPQKDTRSGFVDTNYKADSVTVVGWIKDMPEKYKKEKTFDLDYENIFTDEQESVHADLDEQGRFTVKFPLLNSSEFFCDWSRCFMRTMLEPGKTYFLLYDFKEGRRYFMGDDCRLQNELFKFPVDWESIRMERGDSDFDRYIASSDSLIKAQYAKIDQLCTEHPTLSTRYNLYRKGNTLWQQAANFGQARFRGKDYQFPENARKYAYDTFWTKLEKPYTLHRELRRFLRDYLGDAVEQRSYTFSMSSMDHLKEIAANDEELDLLMCWKSFVEEATARLNAASTEEEKKRIAEEENTKNADLIEKVGGILNGAKAQKLFEGYALLSKMRDQEHRLDSLGADPFLKSLWISQQVYEEIDHDRTPLLPEILDTLKAMISNPIGIEMVEKKNDHYLAIENREFDKLVLKSSDNLKDISEGEALLKKIVEPFKGKFVLLDIWGTWCGPCKEALSHSQEEYERLKDYDIEFLYLANGSPQQAWENVIKEYNVTGDNVAHYNLPSEQQQAIERYIDIDGYPTFKLIDRNGNLLDLEVDARDIDDLVRLLDKLK